MAENPRVARRIEVELDEAEWSFLVAESRRLGVPVGQVIRWALESARLRQVALAGGVDPPVRAAQVGG